MHTKFGKIWPFVWLNSLLLFSVLVPSESNAGVILLDARSMSAEGVVTSSLGQSLEDELNAKIFSPRGMELELASPTGGTFAVDDFTFEGPGLTVIGGSGFILRWLTTPVESVRIGFSNFKDGGDRSVYAFGTNVDYTRDSMQTSQSSNGNVILNPDISMAVDTATGTVSGNLSLTVNAPSISSVWVRTNVFLTSWAEVEFESQSTSAVPEPTTFAIWSIFGIIGVGVAWRRRKAKVA